MEAIRGLIRYPLRTALALLGLVVGVASVVGTVALLSASRSFSLKALSRDLSPEMLTVSSPDSYWEKGQRVVVAVPVVLGRDDVARLRNLLPPGCRVTITSDSRRGIRRHAVSYQVPVRGVEADAPSFLPLQTLYGRFLSTGEAAAGDRVAVLSKALAVDLFDEPERAVGGEVLLDGQRFDVIGVAGEMLRDDGDEPRLAYIPFRSAAERFGPLGVDDEVELRVAAPSLESVEEVAAAARAALPLFRPGVGAGSYHVETAEEDLEEVRIRDRIQALTLGAVAGFALLVAASGILNTLLVGVRERTREIGTRRALGATRQTILRQFLGEALALSIPGSLLGLLAGTALAHGLGSILSRGLFDPSMLEVVVGPREAAGALAAAILTAAVAGTWPALLASRVEPAEALRHE